MWRGTSDNEMRGFSNDSWNFVTLILAGQCCCKHSCSLEEGNII